MSGTIGDILKQLGLDEQPMKKEASVQKAQESDVMQELDGLIDELFTMTKEANPTAPASAREAEAVPVEQQIEQSEPVVGPEEEAVAREAAGEVAKKKIKQNIVEAGASVVEEAMGELLEDQQTKIASVQDFFKDNPAKAALFAELASAVMGSVPRIVKDHDFADYGEGEAGVEDGTESTNIFE